MKKYRYRYLKRLSTGISVTYLSTAILWGIAGFSCHMKREELKDRYLDGSISHECYIEEGMKFSQKEEKIFKCIGAGFGLSFLADISFNIASMGKEY